MAQPEIRFTKSDGSSFPDWELRKMSDFLKQRNEKSPKSEEYPLMAFVANEGVAPKGDRYNRDFLVSDSDNKKYKKTEFGDFIYSSNNLETGSIGLNRYGSASISPVYSIFKTKENSNHIFMGSFLTRKSFIHKMIRFRQGVVYGQWRIHESDFLKIEDYIPCIEEQTKIARILEVVELRIKKLDEKKNLLEEYKKGVLQNIFLQKIRFTKSDGSSFPDWELRKMSDFLKQRNEKSPKSEEYPLMAFVANEGVAPKGDRYNRDFLVSDSDNKKYKKTEFGDFIYSSNNLETGSIGLNRYGSASISPVYSIFKTKENSNHIFMGSFLTRKSFIHKMIRFRQGVVYGQWRIHESDFLKIEDYIPCIEEQSLIANFIEAMDKKISLCTDELTHNQSFLKALIQKMFVS